MILKFKIFESFDSGFWIWFGQSLVTHNGEPLIVYHGTNNKFKKFDSNLINTIEPKGDYIGHGFYFTRDYDTALKYAKYAVKKKGGEPIVLKAYLKIEKPILINTPDDAKAFRELFGGEMEYHLLSKSNPKEIREKLIDMGFDGLIDNMYQQYAVFDESQIFLDE